jgi:hypothetical protein
VSFGGTRPLVLNGTVAYHDAAPIELALSAFAWPYAEPLFVSKASMRKSPWLTL